jgi:hypothetical protein
MTGVDRLNAFAEGEIERLRKEDDSRRVNILGAAIGQVTTILGYLAVTAAEYEIATAAATANLEERRVAFEKAGPGGHRVTEEELVLLNQGTAASLVLHFRIDTFYVFAKIALDRLARLLPLYFGPAREVRLKGHSSLVAGALPKFAAGHGLSAVPDSLTEKIEDLGRRVSDYRDRSITHVDSPRSFRGTSFDGSGTASIMTATLYPRDESETSTNSETPRTLLPLLDSYVVEFTDYLEANREHAHVPRAFA